MGRLGLPCPFDIEIKGYSAKYFGKYVHGRRAVVLYVLADKESGRLYPYREVFLTLLHERVHYVQYSDPDFVRYKGVMHDARFWEIYGECRAKAESAIFGSGRIRRKKISSGGICNEQGTAVGDQKNQGRP
jgi:hypothetical protein